MHPPTKNTISPPPSGFYILITLSFCASKIVSALFSIIAYCLRTRDFMFKKKSEGIIWSKSSPSMWKLRASPVVASVIEIISVSISSSSSSSWSCSSSSSSSGNYTFLGSLICAAFIRLIISEISSSSSIARSSSLALFRNTGSSSSSLRTSPPWRITSFSIHFFRLS